MGGFGQHYFLLGLIAPFKPLSGIVRFILDAVIVIVELLLLLSSKDASLWSSLLLVLFGLYVGWDLLAIYDHPDAFGFPEERPSRWRALPDVVQTYIIGGFRGDEKKRGPPINLL
jgi:hypothetical protein